MTTEISRIARAGVAAAVLAFVLPACGGGKVAASPTPGSTTANGAATSTTSSATATTSSTAAPTPEDRAVVSMARQFFPTQNIVAAACTKTGFTTTGDTDTCVLRSADNSVTTPSDWTIIKNPSDGTIIGAEPAGAASAASLPSAAPSSSPCNDGSQPGAGGADGSGNLLCADGSTPN